MTANAEKESIRFPSPSDYSVYDVAHYRDLPLFFERVRAAHAGGEFIPLSVRRKDAYSPMYVERLERIDEHHVLLHFLPITKNPVQIAPAKPHEAWSSPFFEFMEEAAVLSTTAGEVMNVNPAFTKEYGWAEADLLGKQLIYIPEDLREEFYLTRNRLLAGEKNISLDTEVLKKEGIRVPVNVRAYPVLDSQGRLTATTAVIVSKDSAAATRSLIQLQERIIKDRDQLIVDIMENTDLGVAQFDFIREKFIYLNPAIQNLFDVDLNDIYKTPRAIHRHIHPDDMGLVESTLVSSEDVTGEVEYRTLVPGKGMKWLRTKSVVVRDSDGRVLRSIGFTQDITKQKFSEEMSLKWEKLGMVGHLAAGIAHEVRNPLTTVKGFMQLMDETGSSGSYTDIVMEQLDRIEQIVDELLMLAEPHQEDDMKPADLKKVLSEVIRLLKAEARMHNCRIQYQDPDAPIPAVCKTDEIKHVIINLVKNSIEAMPNGGTVYLAAWDSVDGPVIEVRDEGIGIPAERLPRLGEPFYSNKEKGTGMGLMKSFKIMERHGGNIEFESEEGKGTTARIRLPGETEAQIS